MEAHRRLAAESAAQLTLGIAGLAVALRRRHSGHPPGRAGHRHHPVDEGTGPDGNSTPPKPSASCTSGAISPNNVSVDA